MGFRFSQRRAWLFVGALLVPALGWFWVAQLSAYQLRKDYQDALARAPVVGPALLNGLQIKLDDASMAPFASSIVHKNPRTDVTRQLVFAANDACPYCRTQVPLWIDLIKTLPLANAEVLLLSLNGSTVLAPLENALKSRNANYRVVSVNDNIGMYGVASGISFVPLLIVLDGESRVRVITPMLSEHTRPVVISAWNRLQ